MDSIPQHLERLVAEIDGWLDLRCPERALERLQPLLDDPQAAIVAVTLRVRAYVGLKRHKEALIDIAMLREKEHDLEWLDLTEAWCKKRLKDLPGAIRCMEQLLERDAKSAIGHFNLGCYLALASEPERALDEVTIACGIDASFRDMLHDEPDLDSVRNDERFRQLMTKGGEDPAVAAAEADAFEDDLEEGFEDDLDLDEEDSEDGDLDEEEFEDDDDLDDEDEDDEQSDDDDAAR